MTAVVCWLPDCDAVAVCRGMCGKHYERWRVHGDPNVVKKVHRLNGSTEHFWAKVDKNGPINTWRPKLGPCWIWTGSHHEGGYGRYGWEGRIRPAHRLAYEFEVGPIPANHDLDHLCRVHECVRPAHLEPATRSVNIQRGFDARRALGVF